MLRLLSSIVWISSTINASVFKEVRVTIDDSSTDTEVVGRGDKRELLERDEVNDSKFRSIRSRVSGRRLPNMSSVPTRLQVGSVVDAYYYFPVASLSYCDGEELTKFQGAYFDQLGPGVELQKTFYHKQLESQAVIMTNSVLKEILIGFRGTINDVNWQENLQIKMRPFLNLRQVSVHRGFKSIADAMTPPMANVIQLLLSQPKFKDYQVVFVGHSLGGAVSVLSAAITQRLLNLAWNRIKIFTYGQPRVGNVHFARWFNALPTTLTRVVNENDGVPHLPPNLAGYFHTFHEMYITNLTARVCSTQLLEDPTCSYSRKLKLSRKAHSIAWDLKNDNSKCRR